MEQQYTMRRIKFIWDFRGPAAPKTAEHHEIHLREYCQMENLRDWETGLQAVSDNHVIAFLTISESHLKQIRDRLKPHRAILA